MGRFLSLRCGCEALPLLRCSYGFFPACCYNLYADWLGSVAEHEAPAMGLHCSLGDDTMLLLGWIVSFGCRKLRCK